jgi:hypothetical protein
MKFTTPTRSYGDQCEIEYAPDVLLLLLLHLRGFRRRRVRVHGRHRERGGGDGDASEPLPVPLLSPFEHLLLHLLERPGGFRRPVFDLTTVEEGPSFKASGWS